MGKQNSSRRTFLKNSSLGLLGAGLSGSDPLAYRAQEKQEDFPKIKKYRRLGRTGVMVSDIGSGVPNREGVLKALLDAQSVNRQAILGF